MVSSCLWQVPHIMFEPVDRYCYRTKLSIQYFLCVKKCKNWDGAKIWGYIWKI